MRVLKMRASFGKLKGELELKEGFNCLCLPNESGKSTWSAFLCAMLYGIDTSERASTANQGLPAKERYKPWDGSAMEGAVELLWQGRRITIERSTSGRIPMGVFRAYETSSGIPVAELNAENCGKTLCGVERSVFERTAFIRQLGLAVTEDAALEKRLGALVSTGEDGAKTYLELEKELRNRRNKLLGRAGILPQLTDELESLKKNLQSLYRLQEEAMELGAQKHSAQQELASIQNCLDRLDAARAAQKQAGIREIEEKTAEQERLCLRLEKTVAALPSEEALHSLRRKLDQKDSSLQTAKMELAFCPVELPQPEPIQGFHGCSSREAVQQAREDEQKVRMLLSASPRKVTLPLILSFLFLIAGAELACFKTLPGLFVFAAGFLGAIFCLIAKVRSRSRVRDARHQAELILSRYGVVLPEQIMAQGWAYATRMQHYEAQCSKRAEERKALQEKEQHAAAELEQIMAQIRRFSPECRDVAACKEAILVALHAHEQFLSQRRTLETSKRQQKALLPLLERSTALTVDQEALAFDEAKLQYEQRTVAQQISRLVSRLDQIQGAISTMGDPVALEAHKEQLSEEIAKAEMQAEAIDLALAALKRADEALRSRFSPQITAEAGELLAELTEGKYPSVLLSPNLSLSVREEGGAVMRPAAAMSCGTADQMYLALRLAMCRRLLPQDAPLILDDALVNFDEKRASAAISLLKKEAEHRQVILFTCRKFEEV